MLMPQFLLVLLRLSVIIQLTYIIIVPYKLQIHYATRLLKHTPSVFYYPVFGISKRQTF
jgi:hypothetical protein